MFYSWHESFEKPKEDEINKDRNRPQLKNEKGENIND